MNISAQNLMVLFSSLKEPEGVVRSVTVYPSSLGQARLQSELEEGPKNIWKEEAEGEHEKRAQKHAKRPVRNLKNQIIVGEDNDDNDIDAKKLRKYEVERLQYYFAIIECDSKRTAEHIYDNGNNVEFELSNVPLDLRMVPEGQRFEAEPKEVCTTVPEISDAKHFINRSVGHTNVRLTWDEPVNRLSFLDNLDEKDYNKIDWNQYMNSEDDEVSAGEEAPAEEEDAEAEAQRAEERKKKGAETNWRANFDKKKRKNNDLEMEITFEGGFTDIGNKILEKKKNAGESVWEKFQRRKKEKKQEYKLKKPMKDDDYFVMGEEEPEVDKAQQQKNREQLELLVDDQPKTDFKANFKDNRFNKLLEKPEYALDPTDKHFRKEQHAKWIDEQQLRRKKRKAEQEHQGY